MVIKMTYRGRAISAQDIDFIRALIAEYPEQSRRALSKTLCERWDWRQANGVLRDMVCRGLMLELDRAGHIKLPPVRCRPPNNVVARRRPVSLEVAYQPLRKPLAEIQARVAIRSVRGTSEEALFNALIEAHHYLGYSRPVGEHLKYLVVVDNAPIACFAWSSAARHLGPRDRFIGWSSEARRCNISYLAYNTRFLILPWVSIKNLASYLLACLAKQLPGDWRRSYGHPVYYLETFVDPARFQGTCYRAANWRFLGRTKGLGKDSPNTTPNRSLKNVLGYPLTPHFRKLLCRLA